MNSYCKSSEGIFRNNVFKIQMPMYFLPTSLTVSQKGNLWNRHSFEKLIKRKKIGWKVGKRVNISTKHHTLKKASIKESSPNDDYFHFFSMNKSKASEPEWQSLKTKMETKANEMFKMWIKRVILQLKQDLEQNLRLDEKSKNDHGNSGYGYLLKKLQKS